MQSIVNISIIFTTFEQTKHTAKAFLKEENKKKTEKVISIMRPTCSLVINVLLNIDIFMVFSLLGIRANSNYLLKYQKKCYFTCSTAQTNLSRSYTFSI
jgi:hypothetical protein